MLHCNCLTSFIVPFESKYLNGISYVESSPPTLNCQQSTAAKTNPDLIRFPVFFDRWVLRGTHTEKPHLSHSLNPPPSPPLLLLAAPSGLFYTNRCESPGLQTRCHEYSHQVRTGQDLPQRTPRVPQRSLSNPGTGVSGHCDAGRSFHYRPLRHSRVTRAVAVLLIPCAPCSSSVTFSDTNM